MTVGLSAYDLPVHEFVELAAAADELGFDAIWLGEHVVLPVGYGSTHPAHDGGTEQHHTGPIVEPSTELIDPWVALAAAAARTTRIGLGTAVYLLPLRHPLLTAKAAATLQELCGGRLSLGVGAGWLQEEFEALDVPFSSRAGRTLEAIEVLRAAWCGDAFDHHGAHFDFDAVRVHPRPVHVPLVIGGNSDAALRRAATHGHAWFSSGTPSFDESVELCDRMRALLAQHGRNDPFRCYVRVPSADAELIDRYRSAGIDDVVVWADTLWCGEDVDGRRASLQQAARALERHLQ
jgi:probable F420-dependent oxidoreductase